MSQELFYHNQLLEQDRFSKILDSLLGTEKLAVTQLIDNLSLSQTDVQIVNESAQSLIHKVRERHRFDGPIDAMLLEYELTTQEGVALMCLGEALMRVPDEKNQELLIRDKLTRSNWSNASGKSGVAMANAAVWGLVIGSRMLGDNTSQTRVLSTLQSMLNRLGEPVIRGMVRRVLTMLGNQFILGENIKDAKKAANALAKRGYKFSYDMLGEAALTDEDAQRYFDNYVDAIEHLAMGTSINMRHAEGISVKLSAICPYYDQMHGEKAVSFLTERVLELVKLAKSHNISLCLDAEENDRLAMSLEIFRRVICDDICSDWQGLGLAVQAYHKGAYEEIQWIISTLRENHRYAHVRLVKGAYWDTEIKIAQQMGIDHYPVYTQKQHTDTAFLACSKLLLSAQDVIFPQFATHNAHTVSMILHWVGPKTEYEFQCLHGMGRALYDTLLVEHSGTVNVRMYAPVGVHNDLLPYLVRRIMENGANSSFVNQLIDKTVSVDELTKNPVERIGVSEIWENPKIPLPQAMFGAERVNSRGYLLSNFKITKALLDRVNRITIKQEVKPMTQVDPVIAKVQPILSPFDHSLELGTVHLADQSMVEGVMQAAEDAQLSWSEYTVENRAQILMRCADLLEENDDILFATTIMEAGKTIQDAIDEVREAVDFLRYYANNAVKTLQNTLLPGPTGEENRLYYVPTGPTLCISPWNFPIAIFIGQIAGALAAGNVVIAKPANQTSICASEVAKLFEKAGLPAGVLQVIPCDRTVAKELTSHPKIKQVMLTGSNQTAKDIAFTLARRPGEIVPLVAETGGINVMIVDSSALPEQVVNDTIESAFQSAGQRCSACRILCLQEDIADKVITMLVGKMKHLKMGNPQDFSVHVGPVIDQDALKRLKKHKKKLDEMGRLIYQSPDHKEAKKGTFFAPVVYEINSVNDITEEVFGPILHIVRYQRDQLDQVIEQVNQSGFGLTLGIHSRIDSFTSYVIEKTKVGNNYINRNMIGAVVGVQPFGGMLCSGSGPKAGGPNYVRRLCKEKTVTINTAAVGGNVDLITI